MARFGMYLQDEQQPTSLVIWRALFLVIANGVTQSRELLRLGCTLVIAIDLD